MKWEKPTGSVQMSSDGRYTIQHATTENWVSYSLDPPPQKLGEHSSDVKGRACCVAHEAQLLAARKRA